MTGHHDAVASFDRIVVIFNPHSSGDGPQLAEQLSADLTRRSPGVPVRLCPTDTPGMPVISPATPRRPGIR